MNKNKGKKADLIIAILVTFALWIYVVYSVNPTMNKTFSEVPVTITNESALNDNGYAISSAKFDTIDVSVDARRSILEDLSIDDITVSADVSECTTGENVVKLTVTVPDDVSLSSQSKEELELNIEEAVTKEVDAVAVFDNTTSDKDEPIATDQSSYTVEVTGAKSLIEKVKYAKLTINSENVKDSSKTFNVEPIAVDSDDKVVSYITASPDSISITAVNAQTKIVKLNVVVNNPSSSDFSRTYSAPDTVTIKGTEADLSDISSVSTTTIDLSGITEEKSIDLTYDLPDNIYIASASRNLVLKVNIDNYESKTFNLTSNNITIENVSSGLTGKVDDGSITVSAKGSSEQLSALSASDFTVTVDASGKSEGTYDLTASVDSSKSIVSSQLSSSTISVTLSKDE